MSEKITIDIDLGKVNSKQTGEKVKRDLSKGGKDGGDAIEKNVNQSLERTTKRFSGAFLAAAASIAAAFGSKAIIDAANRQEDAVNSLNSALIATGKFSETTSQSLQEFASELQSVSRFGDEVILENAALIQSLGNLDEQGLKRATTAAADLAAQLRIDLTTAAQLVGRAATGEIGTFSRYGIQIEKGTTAAETFANTLQVLESRFAGAAQRDVLTFSGTVQSLSNNFGDLLEEVGFLITKNPILINGIQLLSKAIKAAIETISEFRKGLDFNQITNDFLIFTGFLSETLVPTFEMIANIGAFAFKAVVNGVNTVIFAVGQLGGALGGLLSSFGVLDSVASQLETFSQSTSAVLSQSSDETAQAFKSMFEFPLADSLALKNEELRIGLMEQSLIIQEQSLITSEALSETTQNLTDELGSQTNSISGFFKGMEISFKSTGDQMKRQAQQIGAAISNGLARAVSGGIQNIVQSLAAGENAFSNLSKFVLSTFADLAIQLGQVFLTTGIAIKYVESLGGAGAIKAGLGLIAIGATIKSFVGGGGAPAPSSGGSVSSPTSTGGNNFAPLEPPVGVTSDPNDIERQGPNSNINVTVEGSLVQQEELGQFLTETLNDSFGKQGVSLTGARFA